MKAKASGRSLATSCPELIDEHQMAIGQERAVTPALFGRRHRIVRAEERENRQLHLAEVPFELGAALGERGRPDQRYGAGRRRSRDAEPQRGGGPGALPDHVEARQP